MTLDLEAIKRRRNVMLLACGIAAVVAIAAMTLFLQGQQWAIALFVAAVAAGFGGQMWLMAGVRGRKGDM